MCDRSRPVAQRRSPSCSTGRQRSTTSRIVRRPLLQIVDDDEDQRSCTTLPHSLWRLRKPLILLDNDCDHAGRNDGNRDAAPHYAPIHAPVATRGEGDRCANSWSGLTPTPVSGRCRHRVAR